MSGRETPTPVYAHGRPAVRGTRGMVSSAHPLATLAGVDMLRRGGNAFDAVVAAAAALNVVEPYMSGLAGLGMAVVRTAADRRVRSLDFLPPVPRGFDAARVSKPETMDGPLASGVPGNLAGWAVLIDELGALDLATALAPAIDYAEEGFATSPFFRAMSERGLARSMQPEWRELYVDGSGGGAVDAVFRQPELARTLRAIAEDGPGHLYGGPLGRGFVAHLQALGGCISLEDLTAVQPIWEEPLTAPFDGLDVHVPPPPAESFQFLLTLRLLEAAGFDGAAHLSTAHLDRVFRAVRLAAEQRIRNGKCSPDRARELLGDASVARLMARMDGPEATQGRTEGYGAGPLPQDAPLRDHTTSLSAVDRHGNAVCLTQSLGSMYGSGVVIPGTGVCLNNFLNWGDLDPASPNHMRAGERLGMCLAPSIALQDRELALALGTPGSFGILQTQAQAMVHHRVYGLDLQAAIDAPRARLWNGRRIDLENRIEPAVVAGLRAAGHDVRLIDAFAMSCGGMHAISRDPRTGVFNGAADSRRDGAAIGL
ncbi:MAG: gamma-glutamyltransferase [Pseudomonadota bacterium]